MFPIAFGLAVLLVVLLIVVALVGEQHRREQRDQAQAAAMKRAAEMHQPTGPRVHSFRDPAPKGFQRPGGGTAA